MNANGDVRSQCSQASFCRYVEINVARQVSVSAFHLFVADTASKCSMERRTGLSCTFQLPQVYDSVLGISSIFPGFRCNCSTPFTTPGRAGERGRDGQDAQRKYKAVLHYLVGMRPRFNQCNPVYTISVSSGTCHQIALASPFRSNCIGYVGCSSSSLGCNDQDLWQYAEYDSCSGIVNR